VPAVRVALVWRAGGPLVPAGRPAPVSVARSRRRPPLPRHPRRDATPGPAAPGVAARPRATGRVGGYGPGRVQWSTALSGWQAGSPPESPRAPGRTGSATGHRLRPECSRPVRAPGGRCPQPVRAPDRWCPQPVRAPDRWCPRPVRALNPGRRSRPVRFPSRHPGPQPAWYLRPRHLRPPARERAPPRPPVPLRSTSPWGSSPPAPRAVCLAAHRRTEARKGVGPQDESPSDPATVALGPQPGRGARPDLGAP